MDDEEGYDLKWRNHLTELFSILRRIRVQDCYSDVILYSEGQHFPAHKVILAACSSFFESILGELPAEHVKVLVMAETPSRMLKLVLDFIYEGEVFVESSLLAEFMETAEKLGIRGLRRKNNEQKNLETSVNQLQQQVPSGAAWKREKVPPPTQVAPPSPPTPVEDPRDDPLPEASQPKSTSGNGNGNGNGDERRAPKRPRVGSDSSSDVVKKVFPSLPPCITIKPASFVAAEDAARELALKAGQNQQKVSPPKEESLAAGPSGVQSPAKGVVRRPKDYEIVDVNENGTVKSESMEQIEEIGENEWEEIGYDDPEDGFFGENGEERFQNDPNAPGAGFDSDERPQTIPPEISPSEPIRCKQPGSLVWIGTNVYGATTYFCGVCGYQSANGGHVTRHVLIHTGERAYVCKHCGRAFTYKWNLKTHCINIHQALPD